MTSGRAIFRIPYKWWKIYDDAHVRFRMWIIEQLYSWLEKHRPERWVEICWAQLVMWAMHRENHPFDDIFYLDEFLVMKDCNYCGKCNAKDAWEGVSDDMPF